MLRQEEREGGDDERKRGAEPGQIAPDLPRHRLAEEADGENGDRDADQIALQILEAVRQRRLLQQPLRVRRLLTAGEIGLAQPDQGLEQAPAVSGGWIPLHASDSPATGAPSVRPSAGSRSRFGIRAVPHAADLMVIPEIERAASAAVAALGSVDVLVNSAGATKRGDFFALTDADWDSGFGLKFFGAMRMSRALWPALKKSGGAIVNMASVAGLIGFPGATIYIASKHAVLGLTKSVALEYAKSGIRINAVSPAAIETDMVDRFVGKEGEARQQLTYMHPLGRMGRPEEIASAVLYLWSDGASCITGQSLAVDGGFTSQ